MSTGRFIWHQLNTTDRVAAKQFYGDLLGWQYRDNDMGGEMVYTEVGVDGEYFGGVMNLMAPEGTPPHWIAYISTDDVDASAKQLTDLGGQIYHGPEDMPGIGRFALVADPQGAVFNFFKPAMEGEIPAPKRPKQGEVAWEELLTSDPAAAIDFYGKIFGWTVDPRSMGEGNEPYNILMLGDVMIGGLMRRPEMMPASAWGVYFEVNDVDASYAKVKELGGMTITEIMPVPGTGRLAVVADPQGAVFSIIQQDPM